MTELTIRRVEGEEMLEIKYPLGTYALGPSPPLPDEEAWKDVVRRRQGVTCLAAYEGERAVATVAYTAMTQNARGALLGMGGVWGVSTHPAARRKGYSRQLMVCLFDAMRASGKSLSCLRPFRESFYERLGYVTLPQIRKVHFAPRALASLLAVDVPGEVELMLSGDGYELYRDYLRQMRQRTHGMAMFDAGDRVSAQRNPLWLALARIDGETAGLMLYDLRGERETEFNLRALRFYYHTSQARYLLLQWIARHIDQANRVVLRLPPYELPETWWADMDVTPEAPGFTPMGRVVDVAGIGGIHAGPGGLTVRVGDPLCPWNEGTWRLETVDGRLKVGPGQGAGGTLSIQGLSALVYGAHDPAEFSVRGWGDPSPETQAVMREMFPPSLAYLHEVF
jgi:predicted acetyltransferase